MKQKIIFIIALCIPIFTWAQQVESSIDKQEIAIGDAINYQIKVMTDSTDFVAFPDADLMGELEVIDNFPVDTLKVKAKYQLIKKYNLTQFDSGHYVIPRQIVKINKKEVYADSLQVFVKNIPVDTTKVQIYDIKKIQQAKGEAERFSFKPWLWALALIPLLAILAAFIFYKKRKKKIAQTAKKRLPPLEEAKQGFIALDKSGLAQKDDAKAYYTALTNIVRTYIGRDVAIPSLETTTRELIALLKKANKEQKLGISKETIANVNAVLSRADLIKFAKFKPEASEIALDRKTAEASINEIEKEIHRPVLNKQGVDVKLVAKQQKVKKRRNKRLIKIAVGLGVILAMIIGTGLHYGFNYLKDKVIGHSTLELLETKPWVSSQYGYPPVQLTTPKLLKYKRDSLDAESKKIVDEVSTYQYGSLVSDFAVIVSTATFRQAMDGFDANQAATMSLQMLKKQGATISNLVQKDIEIDGNEGLASTADFIMKNNTTNDDIPLHLELYSFASTMDARTIIVVYKKDDTYGAEIAQRILESISLPKGNLIKAKEDEDDE